MTMILFEKNNGTWKIPTDIFGKAFGVWHSLGDGGSSGGGDNEPTIPIDYYDLFMPTATPSAGYGVVSKLVKLEAGDVITFVQTGSDSIFRNEFSLYTGDVQEGKYPAHYYENLTAIWSNLGFTGTAEVTIEQDGLYCFNAYNGIAFDSIMVTKAFALEAFNEALKLVGLGKVDSLSMVLASSEMCTALAGNAKAVAIMKAYYSIDMLVAVDSKWNDGLNTLSYKCGLKCYLFHDGNECSSITGGFNYNGAYNSGGYLDLRMPSSGEHSYARTKNKLDTTGYTKLSTVIDVVGSNVKCGLTSSTSWNETYDGVGSGEVKTPQTKTLDITGKTGYYYKCNSWGSQGKVSKVYITP